MAAQSQSPVNWSADGELLVTIENNRRILRMQDNVRISQDSINISGSSAIFEYTLNTQELLRVTVLGTPVIYSQASESSVEPVTGKSDTLILYDDELTEDTIVEMIGNAFIKSPSSTMNCASIIYVTERDLVREALGPCQGALTSQNGM
ncbi:MAG: LptA/OstA family protein [Pseudomonadota bacterium]|nr:LptA/OstA family protein [Pseudomonadota bacterium]